MFYQSQVKSTCPNNRNYALPSVAGTSLRAVSRNAARYSGRHVLEGLL
jgi:hypothetical protein